MYVIDKDKNKSTVTLLTTTGVVTVKVWKNQFAKWDKQISARGDDGKKHVLEKSFFQRGNKLIITLSVFKQQMLFHPQKKRMYGGRVFVTGSHFEKCGPTDRSNFGYLHYCLLFFGNNV